MLKMRNLFFGAFVALLFTSCASKEMKISVANTTGMERQNEMVEVCMKDIASKLQLSDTAQVVVLDAMGK